VLWTIVSVTILVSVSALVFWDYSLYLDAPVSTEEERRVKVLIPRESTLSNVALILKEHGLIHSPTYFRLFLLVSDIADKLRAGAYYFSTALTPRQIAQMLVEGPKTPFMVITIKEGFNVWQVAEAFEKAGIGSAKVVLERLKERSLARKGGVPAGARPDQVVSPMEGFLFPETYYVAPGQKLDNILLRMMKQWQKELKQEKKKNVAEYARLLERVGLSDHDLVTIASLVERETRLPHEKKLIASVILNRIRKQMPLQIDPTLTYSEARRGARPTPDDRKNESNHYNTYAYMGLPPGPICNPGRESLAAAVAPATSSFLYFVAKRDGTGGHHFTTNYKDHQRAVNKYLKRRGK